MIVNARKEQTTHKYLNHKCHICEIRSRRIAGPWPSQADISTTLAAVSGDFYEDREAVHLLQPSDSFPFIPYQCISSRLSCMWNRGGRDLQRSLASIYDERTVMNAALRESAALIIPCSVTISAIEPKSTLEITPQIPAVLEVLCPLTEDRTEHKVRIYCFRKDKDTLRKLKRQTDCP